MDLWNFTVDYKDNSGGIDTCFIDSWKNLYHDYTGREDQYLDYILCYRNELAEATKKHFTGSPGPPAPTPTSKVMPA